MIDRKLSIAPMLDWSDRFFRYFLRLITRRTLLYTEMVTTGALLHGDREGLLRFDPIEHPVALQLGGSDPAALAACARMAQERGYDEVNLNCGCPSDRVQAGRFGACLMAEPELVAECIAAMRYAVAIPVTVKSRIGIDHQESYPTLRRFVSVVAQAGCSTFVVHARKAWLQGLSPKENRDIPPLRYELVYRLKDDFPQLEICINGGIASLDTAEAHLERVDGTMIGRAAYHNPWLLSTADQRFYGEAPQPKSRHQVLEEFLPFLTRETAAGVPVRQIIRHILGLFSGQPGARAWRRQLGELSQRNAVSPVLLREAAAAVTRD